MKWTPFRELSTLHREFDELFNRLWGRTERFAPYSSVSEGWCYPSVDFARKGDRLLLRVDLPGVDPKAVDISVTGNVLTLRGERKMEWEGKEEDYYLREIGYGAFERHITLPEGVDYDKIAAYYGKGILEISMPAASVARSKKIEIASEETKKLKAA